MARRGRGKAPRRRRKVFSLWNAVESFAWLNLMTVNFLGNDPWGFFTEKAGSGVYDVGQDQLTLKSFIENPDFAYAGLMKNFKANGVNFLIQSVMLGIGFRLARRVTATARRKITGGIIKPLLGPGVSV